MYNVQYDGMSCYDLIWSCAIIMWYHSVLWYIWNDNVLWYNSMVWYAVVVCYEMGEHAMIVCYIMW